MKPRIEGPDRAIHELAHRTRYHGGDHHRAWKDLTEAHKRTLTHIVKDLAQDLG